MTTPNDAAGNITARTVKIGAPQQTLGWTPANELRWVAVGGVLNESYRYDANGERILRSVEGGAVQYVYFPHYETSL